MNEQFVVRAAEFVGAYGVAGTAPANVDGETIAMARCELIKQSLDLFIRFCYQRDASGFYCNLSGNTFIPRGVYAPFGSAGKQRTATGTRAQLTRDERAVVRGWLQILKANRRFPVFFYVSDRRRWCVDTIRYSDEASALAWLEREALTAKNYLAIKNQMQR